MRHGLLLVDKPTGCTSHDVVASARRALRQKKIGHCGTLDPEATGLLALTVGWGTRLTRFLIKAPKVYEGEIRFGQATDTYDAAGDVIAEADMSGLGRADVATAMGAFVGTHSQTPPPYCAKKVGGVKFYELARRGEEVPKDPKDVEIFAFAPISDLADGAIRFRLECSSGTYARSLAHELGERLGGAAHLSALRRLQVGSLSVEDAVSLDRLETEDVEIEALRAWIPFDEIPLPFGAVHADGQQERRVTHGQTVLVDRLDLEEGDWVRVVNGQSRLVAVGTVIERVGERGLGVVQPRIVFR